MKIKIHLNVFITIVIFCSVLLGAVVWYFDIGHHSVEKIPSLHGLTQIQLTSKLGDADHATEFLIEHGFSEFRIELYNTYSPNDPRSAGVRIKEWQWEHFNYYVTVWLHKKDGAWIVLNTCRWHKGVRF